MEYMHDDFLVHELLSEIKKEAVKKDQSIGLLTDLVSSY